MRRMGYTMRRKATDTTAPLTVLLTRQERRARAEERWKRQRRRFARRRAPLSAAPTLDAIPAAVPYKDRGIAIIGTDLYGRRFLPEKERSLDCNRGVEG